MKGARLVALSLALAFLLLACAGSPNTAGPAPSDTPTSQTATPPPTPPGPLPILYLDGRDIMTSMTAEMVAIYPDGRPAKTLTAILPSATILQATQSRDGASLALKARLEGREPDTTAGRVQTHAVKATGEDLGGRQPTYKVKDYVVSREGGVKEMQLPENETVRFSRGDGEFAWSPDGRYLAAVAVGEPSDLHLSVLVVDGKSGSLVKHLNFPALRYSHPLETDRPEKDIQLDPRAPYGETATMQMLRWSPDGRKLLFATAVRTLVVDVEAGKIAVLVDKPVTAEWTPGGDGIIYRDYEGAGQSNGWTDQFGDLVLQPLGGGEPRTLLREDELLKLRLFDRESLQPFYGSAPELSPAGKKVALIGGRNQGAGSERPGEGMIQVYDLTQPLESAFAAPIASLPYREGVMALEWSPDESSFATYSIDGDKDAAGKPVWKVRVNVCDLATGTWTNAVEWSFPSFAQGYELFFFNGRVLSWGG